MSTPKLSVRGVRKTFGTHTVLDDVSLDVGDHEVVCLIGASGSGKSTLLRCINLLEPVDDGEIFLSGPDGVVDIAEPGLDPDPIRRRIGMVFQSYNLFPHMSVLRNITLGPTKVLGRPKAEAEALAHELLGRFGLDDKAKAYPDQLSGGQQQRVAIARALVNNPPLILADEPTGNLDSKSSVEIMDILRTLHKGGVTIVMVTHESDIAAHAGRVICVKDGKIISDGRDGSNYCLGSNN